MTMIPLRIRPGSGLDHPERKAGWRERVQECPLMGVLSSDSWSDREE